jgi:hypothetical protein
VWIVKLRKIFDTRIIVALLGCAALPLSLLFLDERTRLTVFEPNGSIDSGESLGIEIGDSRSDALDVLIASGMVLKRSQDGGICFHQKVKPGKVLDIFFVESWHGGMVCVVSSNERVEELIWAFQPVSL